MSAQYILKMEQEAAKSDNLLFLLGICCVLDIFVSECMLGLEQLNLIFFVIIVLIAC